MADVVPLLPPVPSLSPIEVVTLGECLVALVAANPGPLAEATTFERHVAGAEANVAVGISRLSHGAAFIGRVGRDGFGTAILRRLRGEGVDIRALTVDPVAPTGLMIRERRALGPADALYLRHASAGSRLEPRDVDAAEAAGSFAGARWLHVTGITPALSPTCRSAVERAVGRANELGMTVSLDVNLRRKLWSDAHAALVLRELARSADVVIGSHDELAVLADASHDVSPVDVAGAILKLGASIAVVKLGPEGALAHRAGETPVCRPGLEVPIVLDAVGAGDAFTAGFIVAILEASDLQSAPLEHALDVANACGAAAVAAIGDQSGLPDRTELQRLLVGRADIIR